jgi:hypothetical protein
MHSLKFLLDADMPKSSAQVIRNLGFEIEDYAFTSKEINERLREFFMTVNQKDLIGAILIVELSRYRRRSLGND